MTPDQIQDHLRQHLQDAQVYCKDLTGTQDHWEVTVVSAAFDGKRLLQQHRMVKDALANKIKDGTIHALSLKTFTPQRWQQVQSGA